jgi:hypothetical protein
MGFAMELPALRGFALSQEISGTTDTADSPASVRPISAVDGPNPISGLMRQSQNFSSTIFLMRTPPAPPHTNLTDLGRNARGLASSLQSALTCAKTAVISVSTGIIAASHDGDGHVL